MLCGGCLRQLERAVVKSRRRGVLSLAVAAQVHLALERLVAQPTLERLVARVLAHVCYQVAALRERLTAHHTLVWLFTWDTSNKHTFIYLVVLLNKNLYILLF